jgi:hypothetical protein
MSSEKPSEKRPNEYHQTSVRADWKGRPSPGPRGDGGPDDVQGKPVDDESEEPRKTSDGNYHTTRPR